MVYFIPTVYTPVYLLSRDKCLKLGSLRLTSPYFNASGPWSVTKRQLVDIAASKSGAVVTKTFTVDPLAGNPEPNTYVGENFSINSVGLTNKGAAYYLKAIDSIKVAK